VAAQFTAFDGVIIAASMVLLIFHDENGLQQFHRDVLEMRLSAGDPSFNKISAQSLVAWSNPKRNAQRKSFAARAERNWSPERLANFRQSRAKYPPEVFVKVEEHLKAGHYAPRQSGSRAAQRAGVLLCISPASRSNPGFL